MTMRRLGRAVRRMAGQFSNKEGGKDEEDFSLSRLLRGFTRAIDLMTEENRLLQSGDVARAVALLPRKTDVIDELDGLVTHARAQGLRGENLPADLHQIQTRFADIAAQNRLLLDHALKTQEAVMKLLIDSAMVENRHGYSRTGQMGADQSRAALSLDDQV